MEQMILNLVFSLSLVVSTSYTTISLNLLSARHSTLTAL